MIRRAKTFPLLFCLAAPAAVTAQGPATGPALAPLEREMARLARGAGGTVGATAVHVETGRRATLNGAERFPMASTFKVPIAVELLTRVDRGELRLDQMVTLEQRDLHPGSGTLTDLFNKPGLALSVRNLLELMLLISDNSATDVLLRLAGGGEAVTGRLRALGIDGIRVDRSTARLIADYQGVAALPPESEWSPALFRKLASSVTPEQRRAAAQRLDEDPRDTSTPNGMAALLARIHRKELHQPDTAELLLDILRRCRTGEARLKGLLPAATVVAHKTGSIGGTTNDVGILTLPDGAGHLAIAVFVKGSEQETARRERAIAEIARAAHDFFLFHPASTPSLNFESLADRIIGALKLRAGERVAMRPDPAYFQELVEPLRRRIRAAGAAEAASLDAADAYLWLPLRQDVPLAERGALTRWLDQGGARRQIHFHWSGGSVRADGLPGEHSADLDAVYQRALDVDYAALAAAQDRAIQLLRSGTVRVRTPAGTDLTFRIGDRPFNRQDGDASAERAAKARIRIDREIELPAGVVRVAPLEETVNGRLVIPEARFGTQTARGIRLVISKGRLTAVAAQENAAAVEAALAAGGEAARRFREFALGFNPRLPALAYYGYGAGAVRLSLGDNEELGGAIRGPFVRWFFFPEATVEAAGRILVRDGRLLD